MWKLINYIKRLFRKPVDQAKLFSDINAFINDQPKVDYRQLKREKKDLFTHEVDGEIIQFDSSSKHIEDPNKKLISDNTPQSVVPIDRDYNMISSERSTNKIVKPNYKVNNFTETQKPIKIISSDEMTLEIEEEESNV